MIFLWYLERKYEWHLIDTYAKEEWKAALEMQQFWEYTRGYPCHLEYGIG